MLKAIGYNKPGEHVAKIVEAYLLKYPFIDFCVGGLAFYHQDGVSRAFIDQDIAAFFHPVEIEFLFNGNEGCRERPVLYQVLYEILPDPLFRGQYNIFLPDGVENMLSSCFRFYSNIR